MYKLRELERKDISEINKWRNDPELIRVLGAPFRYINSEVDMKWFDGYMASRNNAVRCAIVDSEAEDKILGLISLVSIDHFNQSGELHIMIGDTQNRGKGMGTFAFKEMLAHAFRNLNLQRVEFTVLETHERARKLYERLGFVLEGTKRKAKYKNGEFVNMCIYSMLREDFEKQQNNN